MSVELKVPSVGESISEVTIGEWLKNEGDWVDKDEPVVSLETDKATLEVPAPQAGTIQRHVKRRGDSAGIGEVIALIEAGAAKEAGGNANAPARPAPPPKAARPPTGKSQRPEKPAEKKESLPTAHPTGGAPAPSTQAGPQQIRPADGQAQRVMPAARRAMAEHGVLAEEVEASGPGGRVLKEDVQRTVESRGAPRPPSEAAAPPRAAEPKQPERPAPEPKQPEPKQQAERPQRHAPQGTRHEEVVPMTPLRKRIAERLVQSQQTTATLTTFNEIDMLAVSTLRKQWQERFQEKHGIKLGFMSFFVKAAIEALKEFPEVNAEIRGNEIVYHDYYDIGVAVGGGKGLVVPVIRNAETLSFAEVEKTIADFATRAKANKLALEELQGGTFTVSNGGVYGSLLATPIINPPQSAILGMHAIQERPVVRDGQVVVRPMMYVALSYDHRLIDGRESVGFLKRIKECVEAPERILIEV